MLKLPAIIVSGAVVLAASGVASADAGDQYGRAVTCLGDVQDTGRKGFALAGPYADSPGSNSGRVFTYLWNGVGYIGRYINLGGEHAGAGDRFGWSIAGSQDRIVISAPYDRNKTGRVFVFEWDTGMNDWVKWKSWKGRKRGDRYGWSVATGVDTNNDGFDEIIVGAPYVDRPGKPNCGAVYVISGKTGRKLKTIYGENRGDLFGWAVTGVGRANRDNKDDFAVGAPRNDDRASNGGKVYVISGRNCDTLYSFSGRQRGEQLGRAVAGICRADDDSFDDVAAGAPYYDRGSRRNAGKVVVYSSKKGERLWQKFGRRANDWFGWCVTKAYDVNCDGSDDVAIGAPRYDSPGYTDNGRVYVRNGDDGKHLESLYADIARTWWVGGIDIESRARFGWAKCVLDDYSSATGPVTYFVGAPLADDGADTNAGNLYYYDTTFMCPPGPMGGGGLAEAPANGGAARVDDDETPDALDETAADSTLPEDLSVGDVLRMIDDRKANGQR